MPLSSSCSVNAIDSKLHICYPLANGNSAKSAILIEKKGHYYDRA